MAVQWGKAAVVEALLGNGADCHLQGGPLGQTPLHLAAGYASTDDSDAMYECAEMLLKSGAEVNVEQEVHSTSHHALSH